MESARSGITFWSAARAVAIGIAVALSAIIFFSATQMRNTEDTIAATTLGAMFTLLWLGLLSPAAQFGAHRRAEMSLLAVVAVAMMLLVLAVLLMGKLAPEGVLTTWLIFPVLVLLVVVRARVLSHSRARQATAVLTYVEQAVRLNLPLPEMLATQATAESRNVADRLDAMRAQINLGTPLEDALGAAIPEFSPAMIQSLGLAHRTGRLPQALRDLMARRRSVQSNSAPEPGIFYEAYPLAAMMMVAMVVFLICITIIPKFQSMMKDLHLQLPASTLLMIRLAGDPILALGFAGLSLFVMAYCFATIFFGRVNWFASTRFFLHEIGWWVPLVRAYVADRGLADLCRSIGGAAGAGVPIEEAIAQAAGAQPSAAVERRAITWAKGLRSGQSLSIAARAAGMPRLICGMLATVRDETGLSAVMIFLAQYYDYRFARSRAIVRAAYVPLVVLALGAMVTLIALAIFQPMIDMIHANSLYKGGF
jgi:type II secretory pathway component PulF